MNSTASGDETEVMRLSEVATYLKCHPSTVNRLLKRGELPGFRLGGDWRVLRSELDKWIAQRHVTPVEGRTAKPNSRRRDKRKRETMKDDRGPQRQ